MDILLWILIAVFLFSFIIAGLSMAPWVPTRKKDMIRFLGILKLEAGESFLEIGSGDARVSSAVAKKYPHNNIMGIEVCFPVFFLGYLRKIMFGPKNMKLKLANAFKEDFSNYDAIYVFGMPESVAQKIVPKFLKEAKSGTKLYSYIFSIPKDVEENIVSYGAQNEAKIHVLEKK